MTYYMICLQLSVSKKALGILNGPKIKESNIFSLGIDVTTKKEKLWSC